MTDWCVASGLAAPSRDSRVTVLGATIRATGRFDTAILLARPSRATPPERLYAKKKGGGPEGPPREKPAWRSERQLAL